MENVYFTTVHRMLN